MRKWVGAALTGAMLMVSTQVSAAIYEWSFVDNYSNYGGAPTGGLYDTGAVIRGTIGDLPEGFSSGAGLNVLVTHSPNANLLGGGWTFQTGNGFTVTNGTASGDALFGRNNNSEGLYFGNGTNWVPELFGQGSDFASPQATTFVAAAAGPGAPAPLLGMGLLPALAAGIALMVTRMRKPGSGIGLAR